MSKGWCVHAPSVSGQGLPVKTQTQLNVTLSLCSWKNEGQTIIYNKSIKDIVCCYDNTKLLWFLTVLTKANWNILSISYYIWLLDLHLYLSYIFLPAMFIVKHKNTNAIYLYEYTYLSIKLNKKHFMIFTTYNTPLPTVMAFWDSVCCKEISSSCVQNRQKWQ